MAKKVLNERCPLQAECERKTCEYVRKELECPYYSANAREGYYIYDQEAIRDRRDREAMDEALLASLGDDDDAPDGLVYIPVEDLYPHPDNPRKDLGDFSIGRYAWEFHVMVPVDPPVKTPGKQGLWTWEE